MERVADLLLVIVIVVVVIVVAAAALLLLACGEREAKKRQKMVSRLGVERGRSGLQTQQPGMAENGTRARSNARSQGAAMHAMHASS